MNALTFALVVLAAYRATRFVTADSLLDAWRARLEEWSINGGALRAKLGELLLCPYCLGFWASAACYVLAVAALDLDAPLAWHVICVWAVAGAQVVLTDLGAR